MDKVIIIKSMTNFCYHIFQEEKLLQKKTKKKKKTHFASKTYSICALNCDLRLWANMNQIIIYISQ